MCIWKYDPTEYIQVKLTQKLEKDSAYELKMFIKYDPNIQDCFRDAINELGCYFSDSAFYLKERTQMFFSPQVEMPVFENPVWLEQKGYFTATGDERYLMIGRFFDHKDNPSDSLYITTRAATNKKLDSLETLQEAQIKAETAKIKLKYDNGFADIDKIRNKYKREKKMREFRLNVSKMGYELQAATSAIEKKYSGQIAKLTGKKYCRIRIILDDITLTKTAPFYSDDFADTLVAGKSYSLKNIFFETDKSELLPRSYKELNNLYLLLANNVNMKIEISGHTDSTGTETHNLLLSEARAKAVVDYLLAKGIDKSKITFKGYGSSKPIATNTTTEGRAVNRRVEFQVIK